MLYRTDFRAVSYPLRLYSGKDALENLPAELKRQRSSVPSSCAAERSRAKRR